MVIKLSKESLISRSMAAPRINLTRSPRRSDEPGRRTKPSGSSRERSSSMIASPSCAGCSPERRRSSTPIVRAIGCQCFAAQESAADPDVPALAKHGGDRSWQE